MFPQKLEFPGGGRRGSAGGPAGRRCVRRFQPQPEAQQQYHPSGGEREPEGKESRSFHSPVHVPGPELYGETIYISETASCPAAGSLGRAAGKLCEGDPENRREECQRKPGKRQPESGSHEEI